jgi:hypothetical protein
MIPIMIVHMECSGPVAKCSHYYNTNVNDNNNRKLVRKNGGTCTHGWIAPMNLSNGGRHPQETLETC